LRGKPGRLPVRVENGIVHLFVCLIRQTRTTIENRLSDVFQRATAVESQLNNLAERMNDFKRAAVKLTDSHASIEIKLQRLIEPISTNVDEKEERLLLAQV